MTKRLVLLAVLVVFVLAACVTQTHVVGNGAQQGISETRGQWYLLWGILPLGDADSRDMAEGAEDYTIVTQYTFFDALVSYFGSVITLHRRTVKVTR